MTHKQITEDAIKSMHDAVKMGYIASMKAALKACPDVLNAKAPLTDNGSWLHVAAQYRRTSAVEFLLGCGLPVDILDAGSATPLCMAAASLATDTASLLLDRGANPNGHGNSLPLNSAVDCGSEARCEPTVEVLLRANPNLELRDNWGCTALMIATRRNNVPGIRMLLAAGADIFATRDYDQKTALDIARELYFDDVINYLEKYIAVTNSQRAIEGIVSGNDLNLKPL